MFKRISIFCIPALLLPCATLAQTPASATLSAPQATPDLAAAVLGVWTTPNGKSRVRISRAQNGSFVGKIIWLKQPTYPADYKNVHNPDKKLRSRPVLGMDVLSGFKYMPSDHDWRKGKCYDPDDGKTYTCRMWLKSSDTLMVRGYVWIFHKTQAWHRYTPSAPALSAAPAVTAR